MDKTTLVNAITKALGYTENGGKPDLNNPSAGKSGEMKSIFQFEPNTWKAYSKEITGNSNLPLNNDTETIVVQGKVAQWLDEGYDTQQIASMWNAGEAHPDAYQDNVGTNKEGVAYDTPAYAKKVVDYTQQFLADGSTQPSQNIQGGQNSSSSQQDALLAKLDSIAQTAKSSQSNQQTPQLATNSDATSTGQTSTGAIQKPQNNGLMGQIMPQNLS